MMFLILSFSCSSGLMTHLKLSHHFLCLPLMQELKDIQEPTLYPSCRISQSPPLSPVGLQTLHQEGCQMKGSGGYLVGPESLWMSLNHVPINILLFSSAFLFILFLCLFLFFNLPFPQLFLKNYQGYSSFSWCNSR